MKRPLLALSAAFALALCLDGCDNFSLTSVLTLANSDAPTLSAASTTVQYNGGTTALTVSGGTAPYTFAVAAELLASTTSNGTAGAVDNNQTYTAGTGIGRIRITVTDEKGKSASVSIVAVPPTPSMTLNRSGDGKSVTVSFSGYAAKSLIVHFEIFRSSSSEGEYSEAYEPSSGSTSYTDNNLTPSTTYYYRLYAVAESDDGTQFSSLPAEDSTDGID